MLDADLAVLYGVPTKALNQAVKRNRERFPRAFMFRVVFQALHSIASPVTRKKPRIGFTPKDGSALRYKEIPTKWF